jgi:Bacterial archaeo-eukaryotic release factor family 7
MNLLDRNGIESLLSPPGSPCVSLYFPAHPAGGGQGDDAVRLKNLLRQSSSMLLEQGVSGSVASQMMEQATTLHERGQFWNERGRAVAMFAASGFFAVYRLPNAVSESASVGKQFNLKPLVGQVSDGTPWYLLRLTGKQVALFRVGVDEIEQVEVSGLPVSMKEALNYDSVDRGQQTHAAMSTPGSFGNRKQGAVFHGQGGVADQSDDDHLAFCRQVDKAVVHFLNNQRAPLILSCVEEMAGIYRQANTYPHLVDSGLPGNLAYESHSEVHKRAWQLILNERKRQIRDLAAVYREHANTNRTSHDISGVFPAAREGRIRFLFVDPRAAMHGRFDEASGKVEITNRLDDDDLVNLAITDTLKTRGEVFDMNEVELPANSPVAAVFRY